MLSPKPNKMKQSRKIMGMKINIEIADINATAADINAAFDYLRHIDRKFSTYKKESEITKLNRGIISKQQISNDMDLILKLSEETKSITNGYFDIFRPDGCIDPSGLVKGWAIYNASEIIKKRGFENYYVDAGGDMQINGNNSRGQPWKVGICDPFHKEDKLVKVLSASNCGIATSGTYIRGQHIYDPKKKSKIEDIVSLTVIGPNIYEADRFATAAFAMGSKGIQFIESLNGLEGYMIDQNGIATMTSGFEQFTHV
jgi:thiamine biosynthesis lipoprotein